MIERVLSFAVVRTVVLSLPVLASLGCNQMFQTPLTSRPAQAVPMQPESTFGIIVLDAADDPHFLQTNEVPNVAGQGYGWFVWVGLSNQPVHWTERLTLPRAPDTWGNAATQSNVSISPDGRTAITQGLTVPESGFISNGWGVAPGDPPGGYEITVTLPNGRTERFSFTLGKEEEPSVPAEPATRIDAVQAV